MGENTELVKREERAMSSGVQLPAVPMAVDIYENADEILLHADMPGVSKNDIVVNVKNGMLEITACRTVNGNGNAHWTEFRDVEYRRGFSVPQTIDVDKVHAELTDGVLHLHLPKSEAAKPRLIEIKTS